MAQRICVTGASGQAGRAVVTDLRAHGYDVAATDVAVTRADREDGVLRADLSDYGQAVEALSQADAVVHLANIPAPGLSTPAVTFNANITMNFNIFQAAAALKLNRVVWASSETTLGLPFDVPPRYAPVDEDHYPVPTSTYALSKVASETIAGHIAEWSGIPYIGLRFSNIMAPGDYQEFPSFSGWIVSSGEWLTRPPCRCPGQNGKRSCRYGKLASVDSDLSASRPAPAPVGCPGSLRDRVG